MIPRLPKNSNCVCDSIKSGRTVTGGVAWALASETSETRGCVLIPNSALPFVNLPDASGEINRTVGIFNITGHPVRISVHSKSSTNAHFTHSNLPVMPQDG